MHLPEARLSEDQQVVEHDSYYEITATVADSGQLTWWLQGFGEDVWEVSKREVA